MTSCMRQVGKELGKPLDICSPTSLVAYGSLPDGKDSGAQDLSSGVRVHEG